MKIIIRIARKISAGILFCSIIGGCISSPGITPKEPWFHDISASAGLSVVTGAPRTRIADINGDGREDLIMHNLWPAVKAGGDYETAVLLADRKGGFIDYSVESGLQHIQAGFMLFADFDNDGDQDVFAGLDYPVEGAPNNAVLMNDGAGRFTILPDSGVAYDKNRYTGNALAADFDNDGILDLYIGNGHTISSERDDVFRGLGDGRFEQMPDALQDAPRHPTNGCVAFDFDNDGDQDVFASTYGVSKDYGRNQLWENLGDFRFRDIAMETGVGALRTGNYWLERTGYGRDLQKQENSQFWVGSNGFGPDAADIDGDGWQDIYFATISHPTAYDKKREWSDPTQLLMNRRTDEGAVVFKNIFLNSGLPFNEGEIDAAIIDMDNDGFLDLAVSRESKYESNYDADSQKGWFGVMHGLGGAEFEDISLTSGINVDDGSEIMKRAANQSWFDFDRDGDLDLFVGANDWHGERPNRLFENLAGSQNTWAAIRLEGDGLSVNRDAIGAMVILEVGKLRISRQVKSSRGTYASQDSRILYIGLGRWNRAVKGTIIWPDGTEQTIRLEKEDLNAETGFAYKPND